jgi:hypothetical protein
MNCVVTGAVKTCVCTLFTTVHWPCVQMVHVRVACVTHGPDALLLVCTS